MIGRSVVKQPFISAQEFSQMQDLAIESNSLGHLLDDVAECRRQAIEAA